MLPFTRKIPPGAYNPRMPPDVKPISRAKPLLMLMDGHALIHRAFHGIQTPLSISTTGEDVRGVYGFLNTLLRNLADLNPTHCAVAFDLSAPTFRHTRFKEYKAQRPPTPPELRPQFDRVRQLVHAFSIPIFECEGFEADDVIGTLCQQAEEDGIDVIILTGDTDTLQLVSSRVRVSMARSARDTKIYDIAAVKERFGGIGPELVADIKALQGDASDNIPGVPGVGAKTAVNLVKAFGDVEGIIKNVDEVTPPRAKKNISEGIENLRESKILTTISREAPVKLDLVEAKFWEYDRAAVIDVMRELEFNSAVSRIPDPRTESGDTQQAVRTETKDLVEADYQIVDREVDLIAMVSKLSDVGSFSFDIQTTAKNPMFGDLVGIGLSNEPHRGWYIPIGHVEGTQLAKSTVLSTLRPLFESTETLKLTHNGNHQMTVLLNHDINVQNIGFDTMVGASVVGRKSLNLDALALDILSVEMEGISELVGTGRKRVPMSEAPIAEMAGYCVAKADVINQLWSLLSQEINEKQGAKAFRDIEIPLIPVLARMQFNGITVDVEPLESMSAELGEQMVRMESKVHEVVGHEFNLNSSQQLSDVLFNELRLPPTKRTLKGYSTDASSLQGMKEMMDAGRIENIEPGAYEVLDHVLNYRRISKIKSTYTDALPALVNPNTGRIHTIYNQTGSATGRLSSNDPNIQNIPVRTELGNRVRKAFVAHDPDWQLFSADYSQIELRILAHISQDPGLLEAFHTGQDIHDATASAVYAVPINSVDPEMRRVAKIMNFGVVYGLSAFGISQQTGFTAQEGKEFIDAYMGKYPGIQKYIDDITTQAKKDGFVETLNGRRRYVPEINARNYQVRAASERIVINTPIQGTAADIFKIAMRRVQQKMDQMNLQSMMIVQVHDELIFEVPDEEIEDMQAVVLEVMPKAMKLLVPLEIALKSGPTWGDMG